MKLYHYSSTKFDSIDLAKCDGFWMTTIAPNETDMLGEIGAAGSKFCLVVEFDDSCDSLVNGSNDDVEDQLISGDSDFMVNHYDGFSDFATVNASLVEFVGWVKL